MIKFYPFNPTNPAQSVSSALSQFKRHFGTPRRLVVDRQYLTTVRETVKGVSVEGSEGLQEIQIEG